MLFDCTVDWIITPTTIHKKTPPTSQRKILRSLPSKDPPASTANNSNTLDESKVLAFILYYFRINFNVKNRSIAPK